MGCCSSTTSGQKVTLTAESPLVAQRGTPFAEFLERGHMAVVRTSYFEECLQRGVPFQDRANIVAEAFIGGEEVVDLWVKFGYAFLVVISYPWLARDHPDPHCFHLPRLVRALKAFGEHHAEKSWGGEKRVLELGAGVILDYCSFWQGTRTEEQDRLFKEGLNLINIPYGHSDVTALKLTSTPPSEARKYDDRGWTHFESTVIDGKAPSVRDKFGERNVLTCGDAFDPQGSTGPHVLRQLSTALRKPPLTPVRFREELEERRRRAEAKSERLFTNGKDSPIILERYDASFAELCRSKKLDYTGMAWGAAEARDLALALPSFCTLEELILGNNRLDGEAAVALSTALPSCRALRELHLFRNRLGEGAQAFPALAAALPDSPALKVVNVGDNDLGPEAATALAVALPRCRVLETLLLYDNCLGEGRKAATALAGALPRCRMLRELNLSRNRLGQIAEASVAFATALRDCPALEVVNLGNNDLGAEAAETLAAVLPRCRALKQLDLFSNSLGIGVEASTTLAAALTKSPSLAVVSLKNNSLGAQAAAALAAALQRRGALRQLDLSSNHLGDGAEALRTAWQAAGNEDANLVL